MSTIRLQLAEYLKSRGFTPDSLLELIPETVNPETIYQLIEKAENLHQIDLSLLATVIDGLSKLNGFPVGIGEAVRYLPGVGCVIVEEEGVEKSSV
ncbi:MAG: hypothetical protein EAZ69_25055 [Oscillatoriales cyanobacterium]|nr:MAG: hypothetical protein EAZ69_25055 [Oscillatoriales cyanobacterium]